MFNMETASSSGSTAEVVTYSRDKIEIDKRINSGHYGIVLHGTLKLGALKRIPVAVKKSKQKSENLKREAQRLMLVSLRKHSET